MNRKLLVFAVVNLVTIAPYAALFLYYLAPLFFEAGPEVCRDVSGERITQLWSELNFLEDFDSNVSWVRRGGSDDRYYTILVELANPEDVALVVSQLTEFVIRSFGGEFEPFSDHSEEPPGSILQELQHADVHSHFVPELCDLSSAPATIRFRQIASASSTSDYCGAAIGVDASRVIVVCWWR